MGTFLRVQGKGRQSKDEAVTLDPAALDPLEIYLMTREDAPPSAPLFVSLGHRSAGSRQVHSRRRACRPRDRSRERRGHRR